MEKSRDINVMVKLGCIRLSVESFRDNSFLVRFKLNEHNQINEEIPKLLSHKLGISPARIQLVKGITNNIKNFRIVL